MTNHPSQHAANMQPTTGMLLQNILAKESDISITFVNVNGQVRKFFSLRHNQIDCGL